MGGALHPCQPGRRTGGQGSPGAGRDQRGLFVDDDGSLACTDFCPACHCDRPQQRLGAHAPGLGAELLRTASRGATRIRSRAATFAARPVFLRIRIGAAVAHVGPGNFEQAIAIVSEVIAGTPQVSPGISHSSQHLPADGRCGPGGVRHGEADRGRSRPDDEAARGRAPAQHDTAESDLYPLAITGRGSVPPGVLRLGARYADASRDPAYVAVAPFDFIGRPCPAGGDRRCWRHDRALFLS